MRCTRVAVVLVFFAVASGPVRADVVINEIFYHAPDDVDDLQFIELHNLGWVWQGKAALQELLTTMASNQGMIAEKVASIRAYKTWNRQANQHICPIIDQLLKEATDQ